MSLMVFTPIRAVTAAGYEDAVDITMPVEGSYSNDYDAGRAGGRVHRATDIFADMGAKVHAAVAGEVTWAPGSEHPTAGFALQIEGDDGRTYAYYHLGEAGGSRAQALADGIELGVRVERGQVIGYLGNSGNARHTPPHLHFEIHDPRVTDPFGSDRVNPFASLRAAEARGDLPGHPAPERPPAVEEGRYTVKVGDTLSAIARDHGLDDWATLAELNPDIADPDVIYPGQVLRTPAGAFYKVRRGDTLSAIARDHGLDDWATLAELNPDIDDPHLIFPGQRLRIAD